MTWITGAAAAVAYGVRVRRHVTRTATVALPADTSVVAYSDTAALTGDGALTVSGVPTPTAGVPLAGAGQLAVAGAPSWTVTPNLAGTGQLTVAAVPGGVAAAPLSASGALTIAGVPTPARAVPLSATGTLGVAGVPTPAAGVPLTGTGTLNLTQTAVTAAGAATLTGTGALTIPTRTPAAAGAVVLTAAGSITAAGAPAIAAPVALTGTGSLTVDARPYRAAVTADSPTAWWHLDETSGTTFADAAGSHPLTITGTPTLGGTGLESASGTGAAPSFSTATMNYGEAAAAATFNGTGSGLTVEALIKSTGVDGNNRIIQYGPDTSWALFVDGGALKFAVFGHASASTPWTGGTSRHHVAGTYDPATGTAVLYLDGVEVGRDTVTAGAPASTTDPLRLAQKPTGTATGDGWNGAIDEAAIYGAPLTGARVAAHAAAAGFAVAGTAALTATGTLTVAGPPSSGAVTLTGTGLLTSGAGGTSLRGVNSSGGEFGSTPGTYGTDYHYDSSASVAFLAARGHRLLRLPFLWERVQPTLSAALNATEVARIDAFIASATTVGLGVVLDCHNYGAYGGVKLAASGGPTQADLADLWSRLSTRYLSNPGVLGYSLMNEPNGLPAPPLDQTNRVSTTYSSWSVDDSGATVTGTTFQGAPALSMVRANANSFVNANSPFFTVTAGETLTVAADFYPPRTGRIRLRIEYRTSAGGSVVASDFSSQPTVGALAWSTLLITSTVPATATAANLTVWIDDTTTVGDTGYVRNAYVALPSPPIWQRASQAAVTAIRATGDTRLIFICGDNWSGVADWTAANGAAGWITDSASNFVYEGHHYWDADHSGAYSATYSAEDATAVANGYRSLQDRVMSELRNWLAWLTTNGARGFVGEMGWPRNIGGHTGDYQAWNGLGNAWYSAADAANLGVAYWSTSEWWGTYPLSLYDTSGGVLATPNDQAATVESHRGVLTLTGAANLTATGTLNVPTRVPAASGPVALAGAGQLTVTGAPRPAAAVPLAGTGVLALTAAPGVAAPVSLSTTGTLGVTAAGAGSGTATLSTAGALTLAALVAVSGTGGLTGQGALTISPAGLTAAGAVTLTGVGSLTVPTRVPAVAAGVPLTAAGALTVPTRVPAVAGAVTLTAAGGLGLAPLIAVGGVATLSGAGALVVLGGGGAGLVTLTAGGTLSTSAAALTVSAAVALAGAGALALGAFPAAGGSAATSGTGALAVAGAPAPVATVVLSAVGSLTVVGGPRQIVVLTAVGVLALALRPAVPGAPSLTAVGVLALAPVGGVGGVVTLAAVGVLVSAVTIVAAAASAALSGGGQLVVVGYIVARITHPRDTGRTTRSHAVTPRPRIAPPSN